jgi:serine/threonine protein kinase
MGLVFLGQSADGRPVAVKVIRPDLAADSELRARFRREVTAAQQVSGPFTAEVVDADAAGPHPWLAMAYVAGPSLAEVVREFGPLPLSSLMTLAAGLAAGLCATQAAGLAHGDLPAGLCSRDQLAPLVPWSSGQICRSRPAQYGARSVRLRTFPLGLRGSASMISTVRGHL